MTEDDLVDIRSRNAGIRERLAGDPHNQAFDALPVKLAERGVGPADNTGGHRMLLCRTLVALLGDAGLILFRCRGWPTFASRAKLR